MWYDRKIDTKLMVLIISHAVNLDEADGKRTEQDKQISEESNNGFISGDKEIYL